jgi:RNA polymerase sigma factor (sigma-70 family)
MDLNNILEDEKLKGLLDSSIGKTYNKFKIYLIMDMEDFQQETYLFIIPRIKNFDNKKASIRTYLPLLVMSSARNCIQFANGQSGNCSKFDFNKSLLSLDYEIEGNENDTKFTNVISDNEFNLELKLYIDEILNTSSLTKNQKQILLLMSKGYSRSDIAKMLNKSTTCINITFQRAKEKIVKKYEIIV